MVEQLYHECAYIAAFNHLSPNVNIHILLTAIFIFLVALVGGNSLVLISFVFMACMCSAIVVTIGASRVK